MSEIWVVSDCHFRHNKPFLYEPRGFTSIDEHDETIVKNWNSVVKEEDWVINLGDLCLSDTNGAIPYIQRLKGHQIWIRGNHCTENKITAILATCPKIMLLAAPEASYATIFKSGKWTFYFSHYPTKVGNYDDTKCYKIYCLCGHTHTQDKFLDIKDNCYHVEMDAHDCYPVNIEQIKEDIKQYNIAQEKN